MVDIARTLPAANVRVPTSTTLHYRITVTNGAGGATVSSLLTGGVAPTINPSNNLNRKFAFGYVDLQPETDPLAVAVRYTNDGQTTPTSTLGFVVGYGLQGGWTRVMSHPDDIKLISTGADVKIQVRLGIIGLD